MYSSDAKSRFRNKHSDLYFLISSYELRGSHSSLMYNWRQVPVSELEIERERVNLQNELYDLEYVMKVMPGRINTYSKILLLKPTKIKPAPLLWFLFVGLNYFYLIFCTTCHYHSGVTFGIGLKWSLTIA